VLWAGAFRFRRERGLLVEPLLQNRLQAAIGTGLGGECALTGSLEPSWSIGLAQAQDPEACAITLFGMWLVFQDGANHLRGRWAHAFSPMNQAGGAPLQVGLMALGPVLVYGGVVIGNEAADVRSDAMVVVENLNRGGREAGLDLLTLQLIGDAVVVTIDFDVVVDVDPYLLPLGYHIALGGQWLQCGAIQCGIERGSAEGALIQAFQQRGQSLVEIGEREELFVPQYGDQPAFCQEDGGLDFRFIECCQLQAVPIDRLVGSASPIPSIPCAELSTN